MASPFSGKQSHVTFLEIPGQNKKSLKHNECHNLMFLEFLSNVEENKKNKSDPQGLLEMTRFILQVIAY
jgi:hypothetical protein